MKNKDLMTLSQAAIHLGVSYASLAKQWRNLGLRSWAQEGNAHLFPSHLVDEFHISLLGDGTGLPTLRWLPWLRPNLLNALGASSFHPGLTTIPYFISRHRETKDWEHRYHPPLVQEWTIKHGHTYRFLDGFTGPARAYWALILQSSQGFEGKGSQYQEVSMEPIPKRGCPAPTPLGRLLNLPPRDPEA